MEQVWTEFLKDFLKKSWDRLTEESHKKFLKEYLEKSLIHERLSKETLEELWNKERNSWRILWRNSDLLFFQSDCEINFEWIHWWFSEGLLKETLEDFLKKCIKVFLVEFFDKYLEDPLWTILDEFWSNPWMMFWEKF